MSDRKPTAQSLEGFVAKLTAMTEHDDAHETYQAWAPTYENDLIDGYGYLAHVIGSDALSQACPDRTSTIIDMGCGTGLVGEALATRGFVHIDGADASNQMLAEAEKKQVYENLIGGDLTDEHTLPQHHYDCAIAVGVFGGGHLGPKDLKSFVRPVKHGGMIVLFANGIPFEADRYSDHIGHLADIGVWRVERLECINYMDKIERPGWLVVARRSDDALDD